MLSGWIFVADLAADVADFDHGFAVDLTLNGEIELVGFVGPEIPIQSFAGRRSDRVVAREVRLGKRRARSRKRRGQTIRADAECIASGLTRECRRRRRCRWSDSADQRTVPVG